ncbi:hypothetical protein SBOR_3802 [Sclerotinia borealis F-4128]|uniref:C6 zinc finger domain protein n=1 Tax=Sclerotinia borealis (strain F-4128) TaxID=1432307 RepID=W9CMP3_SCLBF|nr:hypothetical protein SBOR_3802 [Sclerotinia borealis F-4128]
MNPPSIDSAARMVGHSNAGTNSRQVEPYHIPRPINAASSDELTAVVLSCFLPKLQKSLPSFDTSTSQVCGSWVEMLPSIVARAHSGELITAATRAFGTIILDRGPEGKHKIFHAIEEYVATLQKLNIALQSSESFFKIETAAAILCLAMVELMLPKSEGNTFAHFGGLGALINMYSPEVFSSGDFHLIFLGCRSVLLFQALNARKSSFLGQEEWLTTPFRHHLPSDMQKLIGDVAVLPSILEEIDTLQALPPDAAVQRAYMAKIALSGVHDRLSKWDGRFGKEEKSNHEFLQHTDITDRWKDEVLDFWFSSLLAANVYTHMWDFQIICRTEIAELSSFVRDCNGYGIARVGKAREEHDPRLLALATRIYQCMEYLLQDEMMLYGPAAAIFPLKTAYNVLIRDMDGNKEQIKRCWKYFDRVCGKGFLSASVGTI